MKLPMKIHLTLMSPSKFQHCNRSWNLHPVNSNHEEILFSTARFTITQKAWTSYKNDRGWGNCCTRKNLLLSDLRTWQNIVCNYICSTCTHTIWNNLISQIDILPFWWMFKCLFFLVTLGLISYWHLQAVGGSWGEVIAFKSMVLVLLKVLLTSWNNKKTKPIISFHCPTVNTKSTQIKCTIAFYYY